MRCSCSRAAVLSLLLCVAPHLRADLVSRWKFDGDLLDSGTGGNNGTYGPAAGSPTFVTGRDGMALSLNGTSEFIRVTRTTKLPANREAVFTIMFWVKGPASATAPLDRKVFSEASTTTNTPLWNLGTANVAGNDKFDPFIRNDANATILNHPKSAATAFNNGWHHVAWVDENGTVSCYIDGVKDTTNFNYARPAALTTNTTTFGALERAAVSNFFPGLIDDARLYDHALTQAEVTAIISESCPAEGDTTCQSLAVTDPPAGAGKAGLYTLSATGLDTSGDTPLNYTFRVADGASNVLFERRQTASITTVAIPPGTWTVSVTVDDDLVCADLAAGATCSQELVVPEDPDQLVSHWSLDGTADDAGANLNHGTVIAGADATVPTYVEGFDGTPGGAISLSGDDYISVAPRGMLPIYLYPSYTVALWVKGSPAVQVDRRVYSEGSADDTSPLLNVGTDNTAAPNTTGKVDIFLRNNTGAGTPVNHVKSDRLAYDGTWHHVAWVDGGGQARVYIDGVRDATNFSYIRGPLYANKVAIGAILRATAGSFFIGAVDDVRVYNHALSASQVSDLVPETPGCAADADTHCTGLTITGPPTGGPGMYTAAATSMDDSADPVLYTFVLEDGAGNFIRQVGPGAASSMTADLLAGTYRVSVSVDDFIRCKDLAADASCSETFEVSAEPRMEIARWLFEGNLNDEISGNPATFLGVDGPVFGENYDCFANGALVLDGVDDLIQAGTNPGLPVTRKENFTIATWVRGMPQGDRRVFSESSSLDNNFLYNLGTDNTGATAALDFFLRDSTGAAQVNHLKSATPVFDGDWHHVAWIDQRGAVTCYIDGVPDSTNFSYTRSTNLSQDITTLGGIQRPLRLPPPSSWFGGSLDEVRLYNYALTEAEVLAHYGDGPSHCCPAEGDTHCQGLVFAGPEGNTAGVFTVTANALDDNGEAITYTFTATPAVGDPIVVGPQAPSSAQFDLTVGEWQIMATLDDDPLCEDAAGDVSCMQALTVVECPPDGDTHCLGLAILPPAEGNVPGTYTATAQAGDDHGSPITYTFRAVPSVGDPIVVGPQGGSSAELGLTVDEWQITVTADDDPDCPDAAPDASCTQPLAVVRCPPAGDTHCTGLTVEGPAEGNVPGTYTATAEAGDDAGGAFTYTFRATPSVGDPIVVGPQRGNSAQLELTAEEWQISVTVDDDTTCPDQAADATCSETVLVTEPGVGPFKRGDGNGDGRIDISDCVFVLDWLFQGGREPTCKAAANTLPSTNVVISSAIYILAFLFQGGPPMPRPYPDCGRSTLEVDLNLGCVSYSHCP